MTRRVLLIAYFFPPDPASGARRPGALAKFLPRHGWEVDVLTRSPEARPPNGALLAAPHRPWTQHLAELRRREGVTAIAGTPAPRTGGLRQNVLAALTYPDRAYGWRARAVAAIRAHLAAHPPDAVISTSPPEVTHFIARWVKQRTRCAWLADLRDPWSQTELHDHPAWRRRLDARTERRVLGDANAITSVSDAEADGLRTLHEGTRVSTILNGYDPDDFPAALPSVDRSRIVVTYTGAVLQHHDLFLFLRGARRFLDEAAARGEAAELEIRLLGEAPAATLAQIDPLRLGAHVSVEARRPHPEAVARMRASPVLLFLPWQDKAHPGVYSGKIFEYLGARRPILSVGAEQGVAGSLVESSGAGRPARDEAEVALRLHEIRAAFREGRDPWTPSEERVREHSHEGMAAAFARELDRLVLPSPAAA